MTKKRPEKENLAKRKNGLAKKDKAENSEILAITTCNGKKVNIERWHIAGLSIPPTCIAGSEELNEEQKALFELKFEAVKAALRSQSKDLQNEAIDVMLGDLVAGAYKDKLVIYTRVPTGHSKNSVEALKEIQRVRQAADTHLINIIKVIRGIKYSQANLTVKQAQQVNVADKQVNISQNRNVEGVQNP